LAWERHSHISTGSKIPLRGSHYHFPTTRTGRNNNKDFSRPRREGGRPQQHVVKVEYPPPAVVVVKTTNKRVVFSKKSVCGERNISFITTRDVWWGKTPLLFSRKGEVLSPQCICPTRKRSDR